jgi:hypothetical protein
MHPLDGARLKARRAKIHLNTLEREIKHFLNRHPYSVSQRDTKEYREYFVQRKGHLARTWGLIVGDFAHNLRSSLDYIAYEFNIRSSKPVEETVCNFPIYDTRIGYRSRGKNAFTSKPSGVKGVVNSLQPYHRQKNPKLQFLSILRDLDNIDKHRTITPIFDETGLEFMEKSRSDFTYSTLTDRFNLNHGGYSVILTPRVQEHLDDSFNPRLTVDVIFKVTERGTHRVYNVGIPTLQSIYVFVYDEVIPLFEGFFIKSSTGWRTKPIRY